MKITTEQKNHDFCEETIERMNQIETDYMSRAEDLHKIQTLSLYRPSWDSFEEFCMELKGIKYKSIMKLIGIYEKFILQFKFSPARIAKAGGWTNVAEVLPVVKNKEDAKKWLDAAESKTREHLRQDLKEAKTGIDLTKCKHKAAYTIRICPDCGLKERVYE